LFSGEKDREISDIKKTLAGWQATVAERDKEIVREKEMLHNSTSDLNKLNGDYHQKVLEVKRREDEVVQVRNDLRDIREAQALALAAQALLQEKVDILAASEAELKSHKSNFEKEVAGLKQDVADRVQDLASIRSELAQMRDSLAHRLAQFMPLSILESRIGEQVLAFDALASSGDASSLRVMAGLSQLRSAFIPGAGPDDKLFAVKSIGAALYAAWSAQAKDAKYIHAMFAEWQNFLNDLPGAGYLLVLPDLGQSLPQNVNAPAGISKVTEVQLWIVKGEAGAIYSRGVVR
jgi:hypothetical protein